MSEEQPTRNSSNSQTSSRNDAYSRSENEAASIDWDNVHRNAYESIRDGENAIINNHNRSGRIGTETDTSYTRQIISSNHGANMQSSSSNSSNHNRASRSPSNHLTNQRASPVSTNQMSGRVASSPRASPIPVLMNTRQATGNQGTSTSSNVASNSTRPNTSVPQQSSAVSHVPSGTSRLSCAYADEYDHPLRENIKIVIVGDSGCGKSKLAFSQACKRTFSEKELNSCYVPTIWAIDQYKHRKDVQELAQCCIDGAHVSVRIWDTFGDHSKDRNFAYQNADVVVLCFSLCDRTSMHNVKARWLKEIHHFLKNIPVILAGTMLDMRWKDLKHHNKYQSRFNRIINAADIITPDEARDVCETVGLPYYECTVLTGHGVSDIFENAIRAALIYRRNSRMYTMNHLRKVREPFLQAPCLPPEPPYPLLAQPVQSTYLSEISSLAISEESADVVLCCGSTKFFCHKLILVQSSGLFAVFFEQQAALQSLLSDMSDTGGDSDLDSEHNGENRDNCGSEVGGVKRSELFLNGLPILKLNSSDHIMDNRSSTSSRSRNSRRLAASPVTDQNLFDDPETSSNCAQQVSIHCDVPRNHVSVLLHYMYHLQLPTRSSCSHIELMQTARLFKMTDLVIQLRQLSLSSEVNLMLGSLTVSGPHHTSGGTRSKLSVLNSMPYYTNSSSSLNSCSSSSENNLPNATCSSKIGTLKYEADLDSCTERRQEFFKEEFLSQQLNHSGNFAFRVEDETIFVHKYILVARSKFMASLLCGSFRESQGRELEVTDISASALRIVLGYLYCDQLISRASDLDVCDWCDVIEFANRLCLDRLISLVERELVAQLRGKIHSESVKDSILLLDKCQLFNAHSLHKWLFTHLSHNFDYMCKNFSYLKQTMLSEESKKELLRNRWPPVWYIKEKDYYERRRRLMTKIEGNKRQMKNGLTRWWLWRKQNVM
ncbi:rho-related BTB domain-containing protein 1-like isoform X2 [Convolutriloba macropyga]